MTIAVVAEKPSVARDIAAILGATTRRDGCLAGGGYVVTWAIGHLAALAQPHEIDPAWKPWRREHLPMLPGRWPVLVLPDTRDQFEIVERTINDPQVELVVCATDAGREGELIFRFIYEAARCRKPVRRLWISSLTPDAIRAGFRSLREGREMDRLAAAARGRAQADWLVGMNLSRAYTLAHDQMLSVGRVQTPTLALLVAREKEIQAFVPEDYFEVVATFSPDDPAASYRGTYFEGTPAPEKKRLPADGLLAQRIVERVRGAGRGVISALKEETRRMAPPLLYDLSELQRHANRLFGYSAQRTLELAQRLYETRKLLSYPRTDSRHLSTDVAGTLGDVVRAISPRYPGLLASGTGARPLGKRFVDDTKVTDHHAIIPTAVDPARVTLTPDEENIYDLVCRRLLSAWHGDHVTAVTTVITAVRSPEAEDNFHTTGTRVLEPGWKVLDLVTERSAAAAKRAAKPKVDAPESDTPADGPLPPGLHEGQAQAVLDAEAVKKQTRPPKRLTEATLLTAMETAGETLDDKELSRAMKDRGLGTPATRASIIETLLSREYIERDGRSLRPTEKGIRLIDLVHPHVKSPAMTGDWESKLRGIERGTADLESFMAGIEALVREVVGEALRGGRPGPVPVPPRPAPAAPAPQPAGHAAAPRWGAPTNGVQRSLFDPRPTRPGSEPALPDDRARRPAAPPPPDRGREDLDLGDLNAFLDALDAGRDPEAPHGGGAKASPGAIADRDRPSGPLFAPRESPNDRGRGASDTRTTTLERPAVERDGLGLRDRAIAGTEPLDRQAGDRRERDGVGLRDHASANTEPLDRQTGDHLERDARLARSGGSEPLGSLLRRVFKHDAFRPHQEAVCTAVSSGRDVLLVMPTGAGKSLCYQLPGLARGGTTLVVSPLIALMEDQVAKLKALGLRAERIHSGRARSESRTVCSDYLAGRLDFLFIAPERLAVPGFPEMLAKRTPSLVAVDEAHCISQWGHDFRPEYRMLGQRLPLLRPAPVIAMTATATPVVQRDIAEQLGLDSSRRFIHGFRRTNIAIEIVEVPKPERADVVAALLRDPGRRPAILYAPARKEAEAIAEMLREHHPAAAYHAGMSASARDRVQTEFLGGKLEVIVATIAFGMGVDKPDIRTVVHLALPQSVEGYYQEIGRAGRDGKPSRAVLLHSYLDRRTHDFFLQRNYPEVAYLQRIHLALTPRGQPREALAKRLPIDAEIFDAALEKLWVHGGALIDGDDTVRRGHDRWVPSYTKQRDHREAQAEEMAHFANAHTCRMLHLVRHFGDDEDSGAACGLCDVCASAGCVVQSFRTPEPSEQRAMRRILEQLQERGPRASGALFRELGGDITGPIDRDTFETLLSGLARARIVRVREETFEKDGKTIPFQRVELASRTLAAADVDLDRVVLPSAALAAGEGKRKRKKRKRRDKTHARATTTGTPPPSGMVDALKAWRLAESKRRRVPAFRIMSDKVLNQIAAEQPRSRDTLSAITGVGPSFMEKYAGEVLAIVREPT